MESSGNHGTSEPGFENSGGGKLYYIVNRWKAQNGEGRAGLMLDFSGDNAILEAKWGQQGGDKVPWELYPADEWDPNTGARVAKGSWNPLRGNHGTSEPGFENSGGGKLYYIVNRWKAQNGEGRAGLMLDFSGDNAILEAKWGQQGGDKVPWELYPADEWDLNTGSAWRRGVGTHSTARWARMESRCASPLERGASAEVPCALPSHRGRPRLESRGAAADVGGTRLPVNRWKAHDGERVTGACSVWRVRRPLDSDGPWVAARLCLCLSLLTRKSAERASSSPQGDNICLEDTWANGNGGGKVP